MLFFMIISFFSKMFSCICFLTVCCFFLTCKNDNKTEMAPEARSINISKDTLEQGYLGEDSFIYSFEYYNQYGEPGFHSDTDSLTVIFHDLRHDPPYPIFYVASPAEPNHLINIENESIEIEVFTTCCAYYNTTNIPCEEVINFYEPFTYEVEFISSLGFDIPSDSIDITINCSF